MPRPMEVIFEAADILAKAGFDSPAADGRILLAHVMGIDTNQMMLVDHVSQEQLTRFKEIIQARKQGVPVQYLTGVAYFRNVEVSVGQGVFIPRPETESMVGWAVDELLIRSKEAIVVELCAGSGAISKALALELKAPKIFAVEISQQALLYAKKNLANLSVELVNADMVDCLPELEGQVELVIANPPYIPSCLQDQLPKEVVNYEPHKALFGGLDGLDGPKKVAKSSWRLLKPGGLVCCEHAESQSVDIVNIFQNQGFDSVVDRNDLNNRPRFCTAAKPLEGK